MNGNFVLNTKTRLHILRSYDKERAMVDSQRAITHNLSDVCGFLNPFAIVYSGTIEFFVNNQQNKK